MSTLHSQQCVAKCQQGTQHAVHGIHNHALPLAPRTPPPLVAVRTAAAALPKPAGRSRRGPATRSRRARQLSCAREHRGANTGDQRLMSGLGRWFGWAGTRTCNALTAYTVGTNVCFVSNSSILDHLPGSAIRAKVNAQRWHVVVPAISLQVRVFAADLDCSVARVTRYRTIVMRTHSSDGRVRARYHNTSVRRNVAFSQNPAT